jgi:hypothetical protein
MTAQLEAMAIAGRLDLLAYFLGMARAESEIYVRTNAVAEAERADEQQPFEVAVGLPHVLIPEEAAPQFRDDAAPRNGMMPPPDSEMIAPPITE